MIEPSSPSRFWASLGNKNREMIAAEGIENFKRTVANNYFNWAVLSTKHHLFKQALKHWRLKPDLIPFFTSLPEMEMMRKHQFDDRIRTTWLQRTVYRIYVSLVWSVVKQRDKFGLTRTLSEPDIGNPFPVKLCRKLISQDLANSILEFNTVMSVLPTHGKLRIAEIGGGYGRLAYVFAKSIDCEYTIFDIEPTLSIAKWYVEKVGLENVKLVQADEISSFPDRSFDVVLSISTLPEMSPEQVSFYLKQMDRLSKKVIFLKQWKSWKNPADNTDLNIDSYKFSKAWALTVASTDILNSEFFNAIWMFS